MIRIKHRTFDNVFKSIILNLNHRLPAFFQSNRSISQNEINDYLREFPSFYSQKDCEQFWSSTWDRNKLFSDKVADSETDFRLLLPPPNITGSLHLGHSLTVAIQDALCRYHRMNGKHVKWYGGTDHAGIATQIIIEKILFAKFGKTRQNTTREEFDEAFEKWKRERINEIQSQLKSLGVSIDFRDSYFTLSPEMSKIVNDAFIQLFNRGMIYRASYMVNWSYYLQSTLSDIEIEHKFISGPTPFIVPGCADPFQLGVMHYFKYPVDSLDSQEFIEIATTRIETIMGDVALCVHPDDDRYAHLIGRFAFNPFTNEQKMPIIADQMVKPDFGTGVLKLTPAHSVIDHEIASGHHLPSKQIFNDQGLIDCDYAPLNNVHRYSAKELVKQELEKRGLYCGWKEHGHWLPVCSRSGDIIESRLVPQWFLKAGDARYAAEFVVNRDNLTESSQEIWLRLKENLDEHSQNMSIIPSSYRNTWKDWFSRYKDWCISRQIYWGHRIPAYEVYHQSTPTGVWIAAKSDQEARTIACEKHGFKSEDIVLKQDPDVLDTWFSSALLPLSVTGWFDGKRFKDLPLSLMETGHDIIFFWVARMTLLSLMLSGRLPFNKVLLHGMICDEKGKKMSKSKANVVDPLHLINGATFDVLLEQSKQYLDSGLITQNMFTQKMTALIKTMPKGIPICGADILRLSLLQTRFKEQNVKFDLKKAIQKRVFTNKMHHTLRFVLIHLQADIQQVTELPEFDQLNKIDKWILKKLADLINLCHFSFNSYDLNLAAKRLEMFWIHDLCDIYLESVKTDFVNKTDSYGKSMQVLLHVIRTTLKLMHPFMPFITENLYQKLEFDLTAGRGHAYSYKSILENRYPNVEQDPLLKYFNHSYLNTMDVAISIIKKIRFFKQHFRIQQDPLIRNIRIASLEPNLDEYRQFIESSIKLNDCPIEFVNLYEIYKYDDCYCLKVEVEDRNDVDESGGTSSSSDSESETATESNSLKSNEIYLLLSVDRDSLLAKLLQAKFKNNQEQCRTFIEEELDSLHFRNFTKNYKKLTKIVS